MFKTVKMLYTMFMVLAMWLLVSVNYRRNSLPWRCMYSLHTQKYIMYVLFKKTSYHSRVSFCFCKGGQGRNVLAQVSDTALHTIEFEIKLDGNSEEYSWSICQLKNRRWCVRIFGSGRSNKTIQKNITVVPGKYYRFKIEKIGNDSDAGQDVIVKLYNGKIGIGRRIKYRRLKKTKLVFRFWIRKYKDPGSVPIDGQCFQHIECDSGKCEDGKCKERADGKPCLDDSDCPSDNCQSNVCTMKPPKTFTVTPAISLTIV